MTNDPETQGAADGEVVVPPGLPEGWRLTTATDEQFEAAERIEYEVFLENGYCAESRSLRVEEYDAWRDVSDFWIVESDEGELRGVVRVIRGSFDDLPAAVFDRWEPFPSDPVLEMASLAVLHGDRSTGVAQELYRGGFMDAVRSNMSGVVGIGADWTLRLFTDLGMPFRQIGPGKWYMGGDCIPIGASIPEVVQALQDNPAMLEWGTREIDLRDVEVKVAGSNRSTTGGAAASVDPGQ